MSEYQYYEWQTVDRLLTESEQEAVGRLSSHIDVSSSRAVVTYEWGDFKHDPQSVLTKFFDAHLYMANWGSRRLMFRFPTGLLNAKAVESHCVDDLISFKTVDDFDVLDIALNEEEGPWVDCDGSLSGLISLRNDLLQGDYRFLYLAWLKAISMRGDVVPRSRRGTSKSPEPPVVPPGLRQLSPALKRFLDLFDIAPCLVEAASGVSAELENTPEMDFHSLVGQLSRKECDVFLCRIANGDTSTSVELKKRLISFAPSQPDVKGVRRSVSQLLIRMEVIQNKRDRCQKEEARRRHVEEMEALANRETEVWREVESFIEMKQPKLYDAAVLKLGKLKELSEFRNNTVTFRKQVKALCERYRKLSGFNYRVQKAKLLHEEPTTGDLNDAC